MLSYRFADDTQKEVHLATLRDLFVENHNDQIARIAISNAIAMAEGTLVSGELDDMIRQDATGCTGGRPLAYRCFSSPLLGFQIWMGTWWNWSSYMSAFATATYMGCLWMLYHLQNRYYTTLKWLEGVQLELPTMPRMRAVQ
jgi:hypothetical protein